MPLTVTGNVAASIEYHPAELGEIAIRPCPVTAFPTVIAGGVSAQVGLVGIEPGIGAVEAVGIGRGNRLAIQQHGGAGMVGGD
ncbi:hypothetical protein [Parabacteroides sp.]|uniref:hypothetical protein n=1 Tax=Parabacteroides sp. TaxID=1869337 RepID=UPI00262A680F|nr:hypothetical protein [Parabacteroides sp.]